MRGYCKAILAGNITSDPQSKQIGDSTLVTTSIACNDKRGDKEHTSFFDIEAWDKAGEILAMVKKGDGLLCECQMKMEKFEQSVGEEVVKRSKIRFNVRELRFLPSGNGE